ncbi:18885_t:CDS:1, partial [Gigaspora rosea]
FQIWSKENRKILSKTARAMLTWSHYRFKEFKSREYYNKNMSIYSEEYTSKTCGNCGFINNIKGAKRFSCISCKKSQLIEISMELETTFS